MMKLMHILCYLCLLLVCGGILVAGQEEGTTREEVIDTHKKKYEEISKFLQDAESKLADHDDGVKKLEEAEHQSLLKKVALHQKRLNSMREHHELTDKEIEEMVQREKDRQERAKRREEKYLKKEEERIARENEREMRKKERRERRKEL